MLNLFEQINRFLPGDSLSLRAWLFGGMIAVMGALTFAEIGARRPVAGGYYDLVSHAYGTSAAFMLNWIMVVVSGVNVAAITLVGVDYVHAYLVPEPWRALLDSRVAAALLIVVLYAVNLAGIKTGARVQNVLSIAKIVLILAVALFAFVSVETVGAPASGSVARHEGGWLLAFGAALVPVFFLLARRLHGRERAALLASALLLGDGVYLVQSVAAPLRIPRQEARESEGE